MLPGLGSLWGGEQVVHEEEGHADVGQVRAVDRTPGKIGSQDLSRSSVPLLHHQVARRNDDAVGRGGQPVYKESVKPVQFILELQGEVREPHVQAVLIGAAASRVNIVLSV